MAILRRGTEASAAMLAAGRRRSALVVIAVAQLMTASGCETVL
jgi:hypothetical protein